MDRSLSRDSKSTALLQSATAFDNILQHFSASSKPYMLAGAARPTLGSSVIKSEVLFRRTGVHTRTYVRGTHRNRKGRGCQPFWRSGPSSFFSYFSFLGTGALERVGGVLPAPRREALARALTSSGLGTGTVHTASLVISHGEGNHFPTTSLLTI